MFCITRAPEVQKNKINLCTPDDAQLVVRNMFSMKETYFSGLNLLVLPSYAIIIP